MSNEHINQVPKELADKTRELLAEVPPSAIHVLTRASTWSIGYSRKSGEWVLNYAQPSDYDFGPPCLSLVIDR